MQTFDCLSFCSHNGIAKLRYKVSCTTPPHSHITCKHMVPILTHARIVHSHTHTTCAPPPPPPPPHLHTYTLQTYTPIQGYARYSTFDQLDVRNQIALKKILEGDDDSDVSAVMKVKSLYKSCIDTASVNAQGASPLLDLINVTGERVRGEGVWVCGGRGYVCVRGESV